MPVDTRRIAGAVRGGILLRQIGEGGRSIPHGSVLLDARCGYTCATPWRDRHSRRASGNSPLCGVRQGDHSLRYTLRHAARPHVLLPCLLDYLLAQVQLVHPPPASTRAERRWQCHLTRQHNGCFQIDVPRGNTSRSYQPTTELLPHSMASDQHVDSAPCGGRGEREAQKGGHDDEHH
jgi:hypothetical protein